MGQPPAGPSTGNALRPVELRARAEALARLQQPCRLCPRRCGVDRRRDPGFCGQPTEVLLGAVCAHHGEEPALSGSGGAGTLFLAGCTMRCIFCQNSQLSHDRPSSRWQRDDQGLAGEMLRLQATGCHNIEWVSPTSHIPGLVMALATARERGLSLPVVYNTNGYDRVEVLELLEGVVDIYLPDAKYDSPALATLLSATPDYVEINRQALQAMWRQVGPLQLDDEGLAASGLLVRHLVLPGKLEETRRVLRWLAGSLGSGAWISLMAQYYPAHLASSGPLAALGRGLTRREEALALEALTEAGFENGWVQQRSARDRFRPDFDREDPFACARP